MSGSSPPKRSSVFDAEKKRLVIALVANGSSRRAAARYVGCAPSTITRAAARDPAFAEELHRAEQRPQIEVLRALRNAARQPRHWRAAAWLLERFNPADFARRGPDTINWQQIGLVMTHVARLLGDKASEENRDRAVAMLDELILDVQDRNLPRVFDEFRVSPAGRQAGQGGVEEGPGGTQRGAQPGDSCNTPSSEV